LYQSKKISEKALQENGHKCSRSCSSR